MFEEIANTMFISVAYIGQKMPMSPSMSRFYAVSGLSKSALVEGLAVLPQLVNNWEKRGLSQDGALKIQKKWGINAVWLLEDEGAERTDSWPLPDQALLKRVLALSRDEKVELQGIIKKHLNDGERSGELRHQQPHQKVVNG